MSKFQKFVSKVIRDASDFVTGSGSLSQELLNTASGEKYLTEGMAELIRQSGAEGCVLLKNEGVLPFTEYDKISVFGRCQYNYFCVGYGSGGDVIAPYKVNLINALRQSGIKLNEGLADYYEKWCTLPKNVPDEGFWGHWPMCYDEMPLTQAMATYASIQSNKAVIVIGRAAGEDRENTLNPGSYYLTETEENNIRLVCSEFKQVIVIMNCGNLVDMSWTEKYDSIKGIVYAWQGGQESGNSVADILTGKVNPCGKLSDTIARNYEDYPSSANFGNRLFNNYAEDIFVGYRYFETFAKEKVLYPFGFGLSYTDFEINVTAFEHKDKKIIIKTEVKNTGSASGKEVVQVYVSAVQGVLGKAARSLVAFEKTKLLKPGQTQKISFTIDEYEFSSYDDEGRTGNPSCYVLEGGEYRFYVGNSVRASLLAGTAAYEETKVVKQLQPVCPVQEPFEIMTAAGNHDVIFQTARIPETTGRNLTDRILKNLPPEIGCTGDKGYKLSDVKNGKISLDEFISQLTNEELEGLTRGHGVMNSSYGISGNAGSFGGITFPLEYYGIPAVITSDGPAGIRIKRYCSLLPCGTALACTWNKELVNTLFTLLASEMAHYGIDIILSPGMNIHRNPLCGRNFEYYSEDPVLSGEICTACVLGIQSGGRSACPKHFACNNQEVNRNGNDSRVTERALREIYLKGFEIAVKKAKPDNLMTSYNKINGVWSHYNYDLVTTVLRGEWGYTGNVVTDWWMRKSHSPEFPLIQDNAYRVRAQVDVLMPGNMSRASKGYTPDGTLLESVGQIGGLTRGEIERSAKNVLKFVLKRMGEQDEHRDA